MDASEGKSNGPQTPYQPVQFRRLDFQKDYAAFAAGATHAAPAGVHGPIGVILTPDGEVLTWGMVLGDPPTLKSRFEGSAINIIRLVRPQTRVGNPEPAPFYRHQPWQLRNTDAN
jgi:hypothetical protein